MGEIWVLGLDSRALAELDVTGTSFRAGAGRTRGWGWGWGWRQDESLRRSPPVSSARFIPVY